jgi:diguanylate cyclase (GGDEF)-like protein
MGTDFRYGIGFKLALLLAMFGIVAMGLVGYTSYASSRSTLLKAAQRDSLTATQVLGKHFQASIADISGDAAMLARLALSPVVGAARVGTAENEKNLLADAFSAMLDVNPDYFQIRLISANDYGLELVRVDRDGDKLSRVSDLDLQEKGHFPYVFNAKHLQRGQIYFSDIAINHEAGAHSGLGKPTLRVATPVVDVDGKVMALIVINLNLNRLFTRLKADLPNDYQLYLSNHWGDFLLHPDEAQTFGFDHGRRFLIQDTFPSVLALVDGKSTNVVSDIEAQQRLDHAQVGAFVRLPLLRSIEQPFVILGLARPLENVVRETEDLGWKILQIMLVLAGLSVLLAVLVARAVTGPLREMAGAVSLFSKQREISELPSKRSDEIGLLERCLNEMQHTIVANMQELEASRQALKHLAQHDALTGLPNRALFNDRLLSALSQVKRSHAPLALLFLDLDGFKNINDTHGHYAGDLLLKAAAQRMQSCLREADTVGRLGGDEFVILLMNIEQVQDALQVAEKIRHALNQLFELDGRNLIISSSIGVAIYPQHGHDEVTLSWSADAAMYLAKESGGNRVKLFGE